MTSNDTQLVDGRLAVEVDPRRGGCISSIVDRHTGVELLFRASWSGRQGPRLARSHEQWVDQWVGGWHALAPNAGEACDVEGRLHGFHGEASTEPWHVQAQSHATLLLTWADRDGLRLERGLRVRDDQLNVQTLALNGSDADVSFVLVEHLIFSLSTLGADLELTLPPGRFQALADDGAPLADPSVLEPWPRAPSPGGGTHDWLLRASPGSSRFGALRDVPFRLASLRAPRTGLFVELEWSETFPYLWYWEENGGVTDPPWNGRVSCLGIEPAVCATSESLGRARTMGEAVVLPPESSRLFSVTLRVGDIDTHTSP